MRSSRAPSEVQSAVQGRSSPVGVAVGPPIVEIARELQINEGTLGNRVHRRRDENPEPEPELTPVERAHLHELEAEVRQLRMENEFLKRAAAFFAQTHQ